MPRMARRCSPARKTDYIYTRIGNPTIRALEESVAELENGCGGIATSSGMGAVCTVYLALLESGRTHGEHGIGLRSQPRD